MKRKVSIFGLIFCIALVAFTSTTDATSQPLLFTGETGTQIILNDMPPANNPYMGLSPEDVSAGAAIITWEYDQIRPVVTYNGHADEYFVVWEDHHWGWGNDWDIYARRVGVDGTALGTQLGISWEGEKHRLAPDAAVNTASGAYFVVWEFAYSATDHDIYGRVVSSNGSLPGTEISIGTSTKNEISPAVAYNAAADEYLVVWASLEGFDEFKQYDIKGQRISSSGALLGGSLNIGSRSVDETAPAVAYNTTSGEYLVVWQGKQPYDVQDGIYGQRVASNGSLTGSQFTISDWAEDQLAPRLAYDNLNNRFLVVWEDHHWESSTGRYIYGQLVNANGTLNGDHLVIAGGGNRDRLNPDVTFLPDVHSYLVVWAYAFSSSDHDVYMRRVAYNGSRPEEEQFVSRATAYEGMPAVSSGPAAEVLTVWEDGRTQGTTGLDLYGTTSTVTVPTFEGVVYEGNYGDLNNPMGGITMELYCSNHASSLGTLLEAAVTNPAGAYALPAYTLCEHYNIIETDPANYLSAGSNSISGTIVTANWIRYIYPLVGQVLTNNNFWDYEPGPEDLVPPGNWANFQPAGWINTRNTACSIQVEDTFSGLDVGTAEYRYTADGGRSWSSWAPAVCSGSTGTTQPQAITASAVPFSGDSSTPDKNRCKFRISDTAGNLGTSGGYNVLIDTVAPSNPAAITCVNHPSNTWVNESQVSCQWDGASDALSGLQGYALDWDHAASTIPSLPYETSDTDTSLPLSDSSNWYFHVRAADRAGNGAVGAAHYGPIKIDTQAPTAWLTAPASGDLNVRTFTVSWNGGDTLSGVASYQIQKSTDGTTWSNWLQNVSNKSKSFTGDIGKTYHFRVRAKDAAGNLSPWSSVRTVTIGVPVTVRVRDEAGNAASGARVYHGDHYVGLTNPSGIISVPNALLGDSITALYQVYEKPAAKPDHAWAWRVYLTNVRIPNSGNPELFLISDTSTTYQELTVRRNQTLIGFHIRVWVEWDASSTYLAGLKEGLERASAYLYDVSDGQMFFEKVTIVDNGRDRQKGKTVDYLIYARSKDELWPNAWVGHIEVKGCCRIQLPREWDGKPWSTRNAAGVMIHEFGHYGLSLYDEYLDSDGKAGGFCTHNRGTDMADEPTRASIMDNTNNASELCSRADPNHLHNTNTEQDKKNNGETTWETVIRRYKDSQTPHRWTLQSPDTRKVAVVAGPTEIPVSDLVKVNIQYADTNVCAPFSKTAVYSSTGLPVEGADITLKRSPLEDIYLGKTNKSGQITVLGAHNGDILWAEINNLSGAWTVSCSSRTWLDPGYAQAGMKISPDSFELAISLTPMEDHKVQVQVQATAVLSNMPVVHLWQEGAADSILVTMGYNSSTGLYTGEALLDSTLERIINIEAKAINEASDEVLRHQTFIIQTVDSAQDGVHVVSGDNKFELVLPAGALATDAVVSIQPTTAGSAEQAGWLRVGSAYQIAISTGQDPFSVPVVANARYTGAADLGVRPETLRLFRWNAANERWQLVKGGQVDTLHNLVSTEVKFLGPYALFGIPESTKMIYLPLTTR